MADRPYMCRDEGLFLPECDDCSQLEGRVKALEDCCETATEELADHEERISSAENTLTNHTQTLSEQNTRITANSNSISANTQSIGQAESEINSVKSRVTTAESDIDTLQEDLMSAQSDIQSNTDAIDSIERLPEVTSADDGKVLTVVGGRWGIMPSSLVGEAIVGQSTVSGQGGSVFDTFYPVGSYYETSDSTFDPNTAWGGTWVKLAHNTLLTSLTYKPNGNTTAIGDITIPEDGYYMFIVGWSNGKPLFAGLSVGTQASPTQVIYDGTDSGGSYNVVMYMTAGTKKVWVRAQSASANNTFYVYKVNYVNDQINRWHRTA